MISYHMPNLLHRALQVKLIWITSLMMKNINRLRFSAGMSDKKKNNYHGNTSIALCNSLELYIVNGSVGKDR